MKKIIFLIAALILFSFPVYATDVKPSELTAVTTLGDSDLFMLSYYSGGSYYSRKITVANMKTVFEPYNTKLAAIAALANGAGVLTNDGSGGFSYVAAGAGTLTGTGTNHYWPYWTGTSTLGAKSITASKPICSDSSGDPGVCAGTEGVWQVAGSYAPASGSANYQATLACTASYPVLGSGQCGSGTLGTAAYTASTAYQPAGSYQTDLSLLKGTYTNGYLCTYTTTGTLLDCNTNPASFQTAGTYLTTITDSTSTTSSTTAASATAVKSAYDKNDMVYPSAGIAVSTNSAWTTPATYSTIVGLWTTCSGYLKSNGTCDTPSGGDMVLASEQSVTGTKTFDSTKIAVKGSSTGVTAIASANSSASNYTATLKAETGNICTDASVCSGYQASGSYLTSALPATLTNAAATTWTAVDNNASALSIGSTGKADILKVITTDAGEGVTMSGTLNVTGALTATLTGMATGWTQTTGTFTATAASTSTITMTTDLTAAILVGYPLKYVIGGVTYYGIVSAIASNLLTVAGAPLGGDVTALYYGDPTKVSQIVIQIPATYEDATDTALILNDIKSNLIWRKAKSYLVKYTMWSLTHDTGTHGQASVTINGTEVNTTAGGLTIAADATLYSTVVDIATAAYDINNGEAIEITSTKAGNGDATYLTATLVFVTP